jgi:hypothetical protein
VVKGEGLALEISSFVGPKFHRGPQNSRFPAPTDVKSHQQIRTITLETKNPTSFFIK